ncbi:MAG: oligosaccharide flippase family protein, partial [Candidatus Pacebacteria bacterium]|nr:oligosaccharide flippase family protein [Candidatus Paceibacterota bacterium]
KDYRVAFTIQQLLSWLIVLVILLILATGLVQQKFGEVGGWILLALAISFPLATLKTVSSIILERRLEFSKLILPQIFEQLVFHGILIVLAWQRFGAMAYAYAILARSVIGIGVMWLIQPWQIGFSLDKKALKGLISFGMKFQLNDLLARVKDQLFFLALGWFLPVKQFGLINWAKTWSMYPYNLTVQNVMAITFPTFSRLQHRKDLLRKAIEKSIFFISLGILPILVGMSVLIWPLTQVFAEYQKWQPAVLSFVLFALSIGWAALSTPLVNTLNAIGQINKSLKLMLIWTVLTWVLTPLMIWQFSYHGVAVAAFIISFTSILSVYYVRQVIKNLRIWPNIWRQLIAAMAMTGVGVAGLNWWNQSLIWLITGGVVMGGVYSLSFLLLGWQKLLAEVKSLRIKG